MNVTQIRFAAQRPAGLDKFLAAQKTQAAEPSQAPEAAKTPEADKTPTPATQPAAPKKSILAKIGDAVNWSNASTKKKIAIAAAAAAAGFFALPILPALAGIAAPGIAITGLGAASTTVPSAVVGAVGGAATPSLVSKIKQGFKKLLGQK